MNYDRNTIIGFVLLGLLLIGYFYYNSIGQADVKRQAFVKDSIAQANKPKVDPIVAQKNQAIADSATRIAKAGGFVTAVTGTETVKIIETPLLRIGFTNKGGQPKFVELKKHRNKDSQLVKLASTPFDKISYTINTSSKSSADITDFYFSEPSVKTNSDGSTTILYQLGSMDTANASNTSITHQFTIKPDQYMVDFAIGLNGANTLISQENLNLQWQYSVLQQESDVEFEKQNTQVGYVTDGEFDYHTIGRKTEATFEKATQWVGVRQRFFNAYLIAPNKFTSGEMKWEESTKDTGTIVNTTASMKIKVPAGQVASIPLQLFYGPADIRILGKYDMELDDLINLGQGMYAFVRPLNRYVTLPVWDFLKGFVSNFGWVIALLTLFIRLIISPLTYKSYLSGAKMKALRPEIAELKLKHGTDQQAFGIDQMKLFRSAGVNPLGGCIPALFQIPIFFALYSFFNSSVDLRGASFLWAEDLSAFDHFVQWKTHIPLLGSHLSLFTITAFITSLLISIYSMSMTPDQSNPMMKYMPYIFPIFLLFIFNNLPSALTWYYTVSNIVTLALQFVIQNYIIDHDKILLKIKENKKKPQTKSKWAERLEQVQEQQKKAKAIQGKGKS